MNKDVLGPNSVPCARYVDNPRGQIIGDENGLLKLIFARDDMRLLGNRTCFNHPTLGDLYKYATYEAILKRDGVVDDKNEARAA